MCSSDLRADTDPFAIGLDLAFTLEGRDFPGAAWYADLRRQPSGRVRVGLRFDSKRSAREGDAVLAGERQVGVVTSGSFAPSLGAAVAMALVDRDAAAVGTMLECSIRDSRQPARVTPLPFYQRDKRIKATSGGHDPV